MAMDSYTQALQSRRGRSVDSSLLRLDEINEGHPGIDHRLGVDGAASAGGEGAHGGKGAMAAAPQFDRESTTHLDEHTAPVHEGQGPSPAASRESLTHLDEHTTPVGETGRGHPLPASQSDGTGEGELRDQIRNHVIGHVSENEHEQLSGMKPRSLGERAKMAAMKEKNAP